MNDIPTETKILHAALKEFAENGMAGARMQTIADDAGVNKAMLHYYFKSKAQLYKTCLLRLFADFQEELSLTGFEDHSDLDQFLQSLINALFRFHSQKPELIKIMMRELVIGMPQLKQWVFNSPEKETVVSKISSIYHTVIRLQKTGAIRDDIAPLHVLLSIMGMLGSSMIQARVFAELMHINFDSFISERKKATLAILKSGLRPVLDETKGK